MIQEIYIIDDDETSVLVFRELFKNDTEYKFISVKSEQIDVALRNIPTIIIINEDAIDVDTVELCKKIRNDDDNSITPVIVVSSNSDKEHRIEILKESVEYYIKKPVNAQYLYYTIKNLGRLLSINRRISPLTGLPGNVQIHAELKKRISNRENFSVLYLDLDNFKAYNDVYGFLKGDEIIKYTADTIVRCVHNYIHEGAFVGHIGGDDFIAIVPILNCDEICKNIIASFVSLYVFPVLTTSHTSLDISVPVNLAPLLSVSVVRTLLVPYVSVTWTSFLDFLTYISSAAGLIVNSSPPLNNLPFLYS